MQYELRRYTTTAASAAEFEAAFERDLLPVLEESGFDLVGAWTAENDEGSDIDLLWLLRWKSLEARDDSYLIARSDPRNDAFREANLGFLVATSSQLLRPTGFSPLE